jgi:hypothetical protein
MEEFELEGGCQCGAVRYSLTEPPQMVYACHRTICRKISTSIFNISCIINEKSIEITRGELGQVE